MADLVLTSLSVVILIGGRCLTAEARGEPSWGSAKTKEREVGARLLGECLQGRDERGVEVIPKVTP